MRLKQLANQTDHAAFQRLYHDPCVHTSEIADLFGVAQSRLSEFAHLLNIPTRREMGLQYTPTLLQGEIKRKRTRQQKLGPCNPNCPEWRRCKAGRLWVTGPVPCETLLPFEIKNKFETDSSLPYWTMPIEVRVNFEAMG